MPHSKLPEQELMEMRERLDEITADMPELVSGAMTSGNGPRGELKQAQSSIQRALTDVKSWREFVGDSEVLEE